MTTTFGSIEETGARAGDSVLCVSVRDQADIGVRYTPDQKYRVHNHLGRMCIHGNSHNKKCGNGEEKWLIPFSGFGAQWRLV